MSWNRIKQTVASYVKANGNNEIEGEGLQSVLKDMIDALGEYFSFIGVAAPSTTPVSSPDGNVFYLAGQNGQYSKFGAISLTDEVAALVWSGSGWQKVKVCDIGGGGGSTAEVFSSELQYPTAYAGNSLQQVLSVTISDAGVYQINTSVTIDASQSAARQNIGVGIGVNGSKSIKATGYLPTSAGNCSLSVATRLNAGDTIMLYTYSTAEYYLGSAISGIGSTCTYLNAVRLGE